MKKRLAQPGALLAILAFALYGGATTLFTAATMGDTYDESTYRDAGLRYLSAFDFRINRDHPAFSKWFGALYPYFSGNHDLFSFRAAHALLYFLGGLILAWIIRRNRSRQAAVIFAALYFFCPNLKAMASLHVTDFEVALFGALAAGLAWSFARLSKAKTLNPAPIRGSAFGTGFFFGLSTASKSTGFFLLPFLAWNFRKAANTVRGQKVLSLAGIGFVLAVSACYFFYLPGLRWYGSALIFQLHHNTAGHQSFLYGKFSSHGFWNYYLALFAVKVPIAALVILLCGIGRILWKPFHFTNEIRLFFAPALALFLVLSAGRIHIGFRYFLPGLLLLYIAASVGMDDLISRVVRRLREFAGLSALAYGATLALIAALFWTDLRTVRDDSYLSFFNSFAHDTTRNYSDSNNDWNQGIPEHLRSRYPSAIPASEFSFRQALDHPDLNGKISLSVGSGSLFGIFPYDGSWLLKHSPDATVAGQEIHDFTQDSLLHYLISTRTQATIDCPSGKVLRKKAIPLQLDQKSISLADPSIGGLVILPYPTRFQSHTPILTQLRSNGPIESIYWIKSGEKGLVPAPPLTAPGTLLQLSCE